MESKHSDNNVTFGFWIYLMTDLLMFAVLFATFAVLRNSTFGGITIKEIFNPPFVLTETLVLLTSSFTVGIGTLSVIRKQKNNALIFLGTTLLLGLIFLGMELSEFSKLISEGHDFTKSAFLSSFFTLVGTHGLHILIGSFWITVLLIQTIRHGLTNSNSRKIMLAGLFWHFLDIVWIFIFTFVYLIGGI
jgi:cytochrome o ubiquinol oxidase subunit 3